jgi:mannose-6-phosphate isomerase-like protein (cupin superfamily)
MSVQPQDLELLQAVRDFALQHPHPRVEGFRTAMRDWGDDWREVAAARLPVTDLLDDIVVNHLEGCAPNARELLRTFARHNPRLHWEQSYRRQDGLVPEAMLAGYGFAEVIGLRGPFVSERIRAGIGIWGPRISYPKHRHDAEEVYILLCGSAQFEFDEGTTLAAGAGDVVYVEPGRWHGFRTGEENLVVYYLWQAGDLRQTSSFE